MSQNVVDEKIQLYSGKVDAFLLKEIDFIGNRPWKAWLDVANRVITTYIPVVIAIAGVLSCVTGLVTTIKMNARFSVVANCLWVLLPALFSMHLAPKAMGLVRSLVEKGDVLKIRPELLYIMKIVCGLGGFVLSIYLLFQAEFVASVVVLILAVLAIIFLSRPELVSTEAAYPTNSVEEIVAIILFLVRVVLALVTILIGLGTISGLHYGVILWFDNGLQSFAAFAGTAILPFVIPMVLYFYYLITVVMLDLCRAVVSIPSKLDELIKK